MGLCYRWPLRLSAAKSLRSEVEIINFTQPTSASPLTHLAQPLLQYGSYSAIVGGANVHQHVATTAASTHTQTQTHTHTLHHSDAMQTPPTESPDSDNKLCNEVLYGEVLVNGGLATEPPRVLVDRQSILPLVLLQSVCEEDHNSE